MNSEKDIVLNTESFKINDEKNKIEEFSTRNEVLNSDWNKNFEDEKKRAGQDKEKEKNEENNINEVNTTDPIESCKQNGERKVRQVTFIISDIPANYPIEKVVVVNNILPEFRRYDLRAALRKFGNIIYIQKMKFYALVAFTTKEEAQKAAEAKSMMICGQQVFMRLRDCTKNYREYPCSQVVFVFDIFPNTSDRIIRDYFYQNGCGEIERIQNYRCTDGTNRIIIFEQPEATDFALTLDNTFMGLSKIRVKPRGPRAEYYYEGRTVIMFNSSESLVPCRNFVASIFYDCDKIVSIDMLCNKKKWAIVTFNDKIGVNNAMKLNSSLDQSFPIWVEPYTEAKYSRTKIIIHNIARGVTEDDLMDFFKHKVLIDEIHFEMGRPFALIETENNDEYYKALRLNSEHLFGQPLWIKPFSDSDEQLESILYGNDEFVAKCSILNSV